MKNLLERLKPEFKEKLAELKKKYPTSAKLIENHLGGIDYVTEICIFDAERIYTFLLEKKSVLGIFDMFNNQDNGSTD